MKYPLEQYGILKQSLITLSKYFDISDNHPSRLHFIVFQYASEGLEHNRIGLEGNKMIRKHQASNANNFVPLIKHEDVKDFLIYPEGCNDDHIQTAVKKILKEIYKK